MSGSLSVSSAVQLGYLLSVDIAIRVQDCLSVSALATFGFHFSALGMALLESGLSVRDSKFGQTLSVSGQGNSASHFTVRGTQKIVGRLDAESSAASVGSFTSVGWTSPVGFLNAADDVVLYSFLSVGSFANLAGKLPFQGGIITSANFKASDTGALLLARAFRFKPD